MPHSRALRALLVTVLILITFGGAGLTSDGRLFAAPQKPPCPPRPKDRSIPWPPSWCRLDTSPSTQSTHNLLLRLVPGSEQSTAANQTTSYVLAVYNAGKQQARNFSLIVPFSASAQQLVDVALTSPDAWVRSVDGGQLTIGVASLGHAETISATLRFRVQPGPPDGAELAMRARIQSAGPSQDQSVFSNQILARVGRPPSISFDLTNAERSSARSASASLFDFNQFASKERVSFWYYRAGESAIALGTAQADAQGAIAYALDSSIFAPGVYQLVGFGQFSHVTITRTITIADCCIRG